MARAPRTSIPDEAISVVGAIDIQTIAQRVGRQTRWGERRWEALARKVIEAAEQGQALEITLQPGHRTDILRAGLGEELSRQGYACKVSSVLNADQTTTAFAIARKKPVSSD